MLDLLVHLLCGTVERLEGHSGTGSLETDETTLIGNLEYFFDSAQFQAYLNDQVDRFIAKNTGQKTAQPSPK